MTINDNEAAEFYESDENRQVQGEARKRRPSTGRLTTHVPVRFDAAVINSVKTFADEDGMTVSSWIRAIVNREVQWRLARLSTTASLVRVDFKVTNESLPTTSTGSPQHQFSA